MVVPPQDQRFCIVIPCYNHGRPLASTLARLKPFHVPILVVDDGSDAENKDLIQQAIAAYGEPLTLLTQSNQGKGVAVCVALEKAKELHFSHALQVDADGQHALEQIGEFIALSQEHPSALISGAPIYDDSMPLSRKIGRQITHFWVHVETLSFAIKDSMCGFRVYPIEATLALKDKLGARMDFDIEVMVRLYWEKVPVLFIPTKVIYPKDGMSTFRPFADNVRISWLHTRLVCHKIFSLLHLI